MESSLIASSDEKLQGIVGSSQSVEAGTRERKFRLSILGGALLECVSAPIGWWFHSAASPARKSIKRKANSNCVAFSQLWGHRSDKMQSKENKNVSIKLMKEG